MMPVESAHRRWMMACLGAVTVALAACGDGTTVASIKPAQGSARGGETLTITGRGFGDKPVVRLGGEKITVKSATDTKIEIVAPRSVAGAVDVDVEANGKQVSVPGGFTYVALPFTFVDASSVHAPPLPVDGAAVALADGDGDGDLDVFQAARGEGVWVYENDGRGSLVDPRNVLPEAPADVTFVLARDFDGDGIVDLFLGTTGAAPSQLWIGDGKLRFTPSPDALPTLFGTGLSAVAVDLDDDGDLDLVVTSAATTAGEPPGVVLLANRGDGTFLDATKQRLPGGTFNASGVAAGDVDADGDADLFFTADKEACRLYLNDGHGALTPASPAAIPYDPAPGAGPPALGDLDGDGSLDVYLPSAGQDRILLNDGQGRFADETAVRLGPEAAAGQSAVIVDLDLDGHADVAVVDRKGRLRLYRNDGAGRFFDYSGEVVGAAAGAAGAGLSVGDVDGDGDDDLFVSRADVTRAALFLSWSPLPLADADADGDGVPDAVDNCPAVPNPDQQNLDSLPFRCASASSCAAETGCELHVSGDSAYLLCRTAAVTWAAAAEACAARGGNLVTIERAAENAFLVSLAVADAWIGYSDAAVEGTYVWSAGTGSFTNWGMGQPDDAGGNEDCVAIAADGIWNDLPCDALRGFICEDRRSRAPDPGDACDPCPTIYEPGSEPVAADAGMCVSMDGGATE